MYTFIAIPIKMMGNNNEASTVEQVSMPIYLLLYA
jgi:hypothetical protein